MQIILLHDHFDADHLEQVKTEMLSRGAPSIRVYPVDENDEVYQAIEGCHRLRACEALGIEPEIVILPADTPMIDETDTQIVDWDGPTVETIGELGYNDNYTIEF